MKCLKKKNKLNGYKFNKIVLTESNNFNPQTVQQNVGVQQPMGVNAQRPMNQNPGIDINQMLQYTAKQVEPVIAQYNPLRQLIRNVRAARMNRMRQGAYQPYNYNRPNSYQRMMGVRNRLPQTPIQPTTQYASEGYMYSENMFSSLSAHSLNIAKTVWSILVRCAHGVQNVPTLIADFNRSICYGRLSNITAGTVKGAVSLFEDIGSKMVSLESGAQISGSIQSPIKADLVDFVGEIVRTYLPKVADNNEAIISFCATLPVILIACKAIYEFYQGYRTGSSGVYN